MIQIEVKCEAAQAVLKAAAARCRNLAPAMKVIATRLKADIARNFDQGGWWPKKWQPSKRARDKGGQTLVDHGLLRRSIQTASGADWARAGSDVKYAAVHQFGHTFPPRVVRARNARALKIPVPGGTFVFRKSARLPRIVVPARPFLPVTAEGRLAPGTEAFVLRALGKYVAEGKA